MVESVGSIKAEIILRNEQFKRSVDESKRKVAELNQSAKTASAGVKEMGDTSDKAAKNVEKLGGKSKEVSKDIKAIHRASLAVGGAITLGLGASIKTAADFQSAMNKVAAISGATGDDFKKLEKAARDLGASTQYSASEAADGMALLAQAGFKVNDIIGAMPAVLNLAAAAQIDMASAADAVAGVMSNFGIKAQDTGYAVDVMVQAINDANMDMPDLVEAMKYVGPVAESLGVSLEDTVAALGAMSNAGIKGSEAGTALRASLLSLVNPTGQTIKALDKLGIKVTDSSGKMKPLPKLVGDIAEKLQGMTDAQKAQAVAQLVGTEATSGFLALISTGEKKLGDFSSSLHKAGGTAEKIAKTQMKGLNGQFKEFQSALEELGIEVGDDLLPLFTDLTRGATNFVRAISGTNEVFTSSALKAAGTAAAIALIGSSIAKVAKAMSAFAMTPAGMVITALSLIGGTIMGVTSAMHKLNEVNTEAADKMAKTHAENSKMIDEFENLRIRSHLTNEEFAEYVDLQSRIKKETDPKIIADLKDRMEELQTKSGFSNDELDRMVQLNQDLTDNIPEATAKITDQGNRIADTTGKLKEYNRELAEHTLREYEKELNKAIANHKENVAKMKETQDKLNAGLDEEKRLREMLMNYDQKQIDKMIDQIRLKISSRTTTAQERVELQKQLGYLEQGKDGLRKLLALRMEENDQLQKTLDKQKKQVDKVEEIRQKMIKVAFEEEGLNYKRGRGVDWLQEQIDKLEAQRRKIQQTTPANERNTAAYRNQIKEIDTQISKFQRVLDKVKEINKEAGKSINKKVTLTLDEQRYQAGIDRVYQNLKARGLVRHQGGIVTDPTRELPKFHDGGSPAFRTLPMFNEVDVRLLRNEMVLTEAQQAQLFRMLDNPASSPSVTIENDERMLEMLSAIYSAIKQNRGDVVLKINGREFARATGDDIEEYLTKKQRIIQRFKGF